jgi:hypothetical protein
MTGFEVCGSAGKTISGALRWEVRRGRLQRLRRGYFGPAALPRTTEQRIHRRALALRAEAAVNTGRTDDRFWDRFSAYLLGLRAGTSPAPSPSARTRRRAAAQCGAWPAGPIGRPQRTRLSQLPRRGADEGVVGAVAAERQASSVRPSGRCGQEKPSRSPRFVWNFQMSRHRCCWCATAFQVPVTLGVASRRLADATPALPALTFAT